MRHFVRNFLYCFCQPPQDPKVTPGKMLLVAEFFTYDGTAATVRSAQLASSAIAATEAFGQAECTGQILNLQPDGWHLHTMVYVDQRDAYALRTCSLTTRENFIKTVHAGQTTVAVDSALW